MNGNRILVDTNVVIYFFNNQHNVVEFLRGKEVYLSSITEIELLSFPKLTENETAVIKNFLNDCTIVELTSRVKIQTVEIRKTHKLKLPDSIVAATSNFLKIPLFTSDKDFTRIQSIDVILLEM